VNKAQLLKHTRVCGNLLIVPQHVRHPQAYLQAPAFLEGFT